LSIVVRLPWNLAKKVVVLGCKTTKTILNLPWKLTMFKRIIDFHLDIGLCQAILGSDISEWFLRPLEGFENRGEIAEGFIGQELICYASPESKAEIHFWKRTEKNSAAEIDYLLQRRNCIIPIEVKSGHGNTLRSLHLFWV
jgi:hypothetical protein